MPYGYSGEDGLVLLLNPKEDNYFNKVARFGILGKEESSFNHVKKKNILWHLLETILQLLNTRPTYSDY